MSNHRTIHRSKRSFSLVEILVAFVLLVMTAALLIAPGKQRVKQARFIADAREFEKEMAFAKQAALIKDELVHLQLHFEKGVLLYTFGDGASKKITALRLASLNEKKIDHKELVFHPKNSDLTTLVLNGPLTKEVHF